MTLLKAKVDAYALAEAAIRGAAIDARNRRIRVRPGTAGVLWGELSNTWVEDPAEEGVTPIGAVLLGREMIQEQPWVAVAEALGVSVRWVDGFEDGWNGHDLPSESTLYRAGVQFAQELRRELLR